MRGIGSVGGSGLSDGREAIIQAWSKAALFCLAVIALAVMSDALIAATTDGFSSATTQIQGWVSGNVGKIAALIALGVGMFICAVRKDWSQLLNAVFISMGVGVIAGLIDASFTATI